MPILDEIQQLEQEAEAKKESREPDGFLNLIKQKVYRTEEEKEIAALRRELPDESKRNLHIETCPSCDGTGLDTRESGTEHEFLTECQRCVGTGRMLIEIQEDPFTFDTYALTVEDGCDVCNGDGTVSVKAEPPLVTCTNCDGHGQINTHDGYPPDHEILQTCRTCRGLGFSGTDSIRTV
jgi:DnaJ-class molecular chaperone